ncbi:methyltransferase family protein [Aliiglaciecola litoralis]|uniref:Isoprenylcysteine carboxylmethyltransferase family protein n=1 Tax=Aliiglaciecola litoralis TaxID=582857 RepID=A0ABN1LCQ5_9ALTE
MSVYQFSEWFLALFFSFVAVFYTINITLKKRRFKQASLATMGTPFSLHWWNHATFHLFRVLIWGLCVVRIAYPEVDVVLGKFDLLFIPLLQIVGMVFMLIGFSLAGVSGRDLQHNWRSGIYLDKPKTLVKSGVYRISRNPAFSGVILAQLGFFMVLPSIFTLVCLAVGVLSLRIQVMLEENHLSNLFGEQYTRYAQSTPRWF